MGGQPIREAHLKNVLFVYLLSPFFRRLYLSKPSILACEFTLSQPSVRSVWRSLKGEKFKCGGCFLAAVGLEKLRGQWRLLVHVARLLLSPWKGFVGGL